MLRATLKRQRAAVESRLRTLPDNGKNMWVFVSPDTQVKKLFNLPDENDGPVTDAGNRFKYRLLTVCNRMGDGDGPFDPEKMNVAPAVARFERAMRDMNRETSAMLLSILKNADAGKWTYDETGKRVRSLFTRDRACRTAKGVTKVMMADAARIMSNKEG